MSTAKRVKPLIGLTPPPKPVNLSLSPEQMDYLFTLLAAHPYRDVAGFIDMLRKQVEGQ